MRNYQKSISNSILAVLLFLLPIYKASAQTSNQTPAPFLGWNSYDCYGSHINKKYHLYDIWGKRIIEDAETFIFEIPGNDVLFIRFKEK